MSDGRDAAVVGAGTCAFCGCAGDCRLGAGEECGWLNAERTCCTNPSCLWARKSLLDRAGRATEKTRRDAVSKVLTRWTRERAEFKAMKQKQERRRRKRLAKERA